MALSWTQASCVTCWNERHPDRPVAPGTPERGYLEVCSYCGEKTCSGIYGKEVA